MLNGCLYMHSFIDPNFPSTIFVRKQMRRCANLLKRFPDSDEEALKEKFPLVDVSMVKRWKRVLGHHHNHEYDIYVNPKNPYGN